MFIVNKRGEAVWCSNAGAAAWRSSGRHEPAAASRPQNTPRPDEWFERGAELLEARRYDEALVCFEEALRLHHPQAERAIARCREKLGKKADERFFGWGENAGDIGPL